MRLGELIEALNAHIRRKGGSEFVRFGFGEPFSWRGDYSEVCFRPVENTSTLLMLGHAQSAVDATFEGYKGGQFTMSLNTPCHVNQHGDCGDDLLTPFMLAWMLDEPVESWDWDEVDFPWKPEVSS